MLGLLLLGASLAADPTVAATVNGEVIRLDEVDTVLRRRPAPDSPLTADQTARLRREVLESLIDDRLFRQYVVTHGPKVTDEELNKHFTALKTALAKRGQTAQEFFKEAGTTEVEARSTLAVTISFQKLVENQATPEVLKAYYEARKDKFDRNEVRASIIVLRVPVALGESETKTATEKLTAVRKEILEGKVTFASAAKAKSFDPSASAGGDVGFISRNDGRYDETIVETAFALKANELSEPIRVTGGVALVLTTERKAGVAVTFDKIREEVREAYAEEVRVKVVERQRKAVPVTIAK